MRIFFDNCTAPVLAATLNGFVQHLGHHAIHIRDLPCGPHAKDVEWIEFLSGSGDDWLVVTGDLRIHRNRAERLAFRQARLKGFVLASSYNNFPMNQRASMRLTDPPVLFELPAHRSSRIRSLPL